MTKTGRRIAADPADVAQVGFDVLSHRDLDALLRHRAAWCVSVYLPMYRHGGEPQQGHIRLKNAIHTVEEELRASGAPAEAIAAVRSAAGTIEEAASWRHPSDGLAVFVAPGWLRWFRLPLHFAELAAVSDRFVVTPLLALLTDGGRFFLLALSENEARLFECARLSVRQVEVNLPSGVADALRFDQLHKERSAHEGGRGGLGTTVIGHGQGIGGEVQKERTGRYLQILDRALRPVLHGQQAPLVLAGVESIRAMYRGLSTYPHVVDEGIAGNADQASAAELHALAWPMVEPIFARRRRDDAARCRALLGTGLASTDADEISGAARSGRVEVLFVPTGRHAWAGPEATDRSAGANTAEAMAEPDLLEAAAAHTILAGGTVHVAEPEEMPSPSHAAAIFRF